MINLCLAPSAERFLHRDDDHECEVGQYSQAAQTGQQDGGDSLLLRNTVPRISTLYQETRAELCGRKGEEFGKFTYLKGSSTFFKEFTWENCGKLGSVLQKCVKVVKTFRVKLVKYFSPGGEESDDDPPRYTQSLASKLAGSRSPHLSLPMREMISSNIWARLTSHSSKASLHHHGHLVALSHRFTALRSNCNYADQLMTSAGLERIILN